MTVLFQQVSVKNVLQTVYDCFISIGFSKECFTDCILLLFQQVSVKNVLQTVYDCFISIGFSQECFTDCI